MILFLSRYPNTKDEFKDGFFQRVVNIDKFFEHDERTYLDVSIFNYGTSIRKIEGRRTTLQCNFFLHFFTILGLFKKAELTYIQSIHNLLYTFLFVKFVKGRYVLDLHGVVVEELVAQNLAGRAKLFRYIEWIAYPALDFVVAVTENLANVYKSKFPEAKAQYILYAIMPNNLSEAASEEHYAADKVQVIYSGNTQVWQNIDLMFQTIANNQSNRIVYTILTGELEKMIHKIKEYGLSLSDNLIVKSVMPNELASYYAATHYGFILRDDNLINNVACPTKMIEYLNYGIVPVVLSENIGDFLILGFEYLRLEDYNTTIPAVKSKRNREIIKILSERAQIDVRSLVMPSVIATG